MHAIHLNKDETPLFTTRKHWIILLRDTLGTVIGGLLPTLILIGASSLGVMPEILRGYIPLLTILIALWSLVAWLALAILWTNFYLDIWMITNTRIINIEQIDLFNRRVVSWNIADIREIAIHKENVLQEFFNFGTVAIETAGASADEYEHIEGIPDPERVRSIIMERVHPTPAAPAVTPSVPAATV